MFIKAQAISGTSVNFHGSEKEKRGLVLGLDFKKMPTKTDNMM